MLIVLEGSINGEGVGSIFNTEYLFSETENDLKIAKRLVKMGSGFVAVIKFNSIYSVLGKSFHKITSNLPIKELHKKRQEYVDKLELSDLTIVEKLGEGQVSKVYCVTDNLHRLYTIKCICKGEAS